MYIKNTNGTFHITNKKSFLSAYNNDPIINPILKKNKARFSSKKIEKSLLMVIPEIQNQQQSI